MQSASIETNDTNTRPLGKSDKIREKRRARNFQIKRPIKPTRGGGGKRWWTSSGEGKIVILVHQLYYKNQIRP